MVVTWRYSNVTSGASLSWIWSWRLDGGVMRPIVLLSVSGRARQTNSQPPCPESHRSWRRTKCGESLVSCLASVLEASMQVVLSRAAVPGQQVTSACHCYGRRRWRWRWLDGWMDVGGAWGEGARQQEGLLAAATKLEARLGVGVGAPATEYYCRP